MHGGTQAVNVQTTPAGAQCTMRPIGADHTEPLARVLTPGFAVLNRDTVYTVACEKDGATASGTLHSALDMWLLGDVITGIIPGLLVDLTTGASRTLSPGSISLKLAKQGP